MDGYAAQQSLREQYEATSQSDPIYKADLIVEVNELIPAAQAGLAERNYPRHVNAAFRAEPIWFGDPMRLVYAWTREEGYGFVTLGYARIPESTMRLGVLMDDVTHRLIPIWTPHVKHYGYGECQLEELNAPQLVALREILKQLKGDPKVQKWQIEPLAGLPD